MIVTTPATPKKVRLQDSSYCKAVQRYNIYVIYTNKIVKNDKNFRKCREYPKRKGY